MPSSAVLLTTCVLVGPLAAAAQPHARPAVEARAVEGDVVHAESGAVLAGATVVLLPATPGALVADAGRGGAFLSGARRTTTDSAGRYRFGDVTPGAYVLRVNRLGFRPATIDVELRAADRPSGAAGSGAAGSGAAGSGAAGPGSGAARVSVGLTVVPIRLRAVAVTAAAPEPYARSACGKRVFSPPTPARSPTPTSRTRSRSAKRTSSARCSTCPACRRRAT